MSSVKKIYNLGNRIKKVTESKSFRISFISFITLFLFFGMFNVHAQEDGGAIKPDWEGEKKFHNIVNGADETEDNSQTSLGQQNVTALWTGVWYWGGEGGLDEETIQKLEASNVPYDLRKGLIGMANDAAVAVYANYPWVNIPDHLAQQWVPGYKDSTTALYAQNEEIPSGYNELQAAGIQSLWTDVLNLAYIFFVIVMIIAGFMIMFRHKIGGQAMVTLGNVLPNVIIALIVATFSFAIAGLIIDLGGLLISLIVSIFNLSDVAIPISGFGPIASSALGIKQMVSTFVEGITSAFGFGGKNFFSGPGKFLLLFGLSGGIGLLVTFIVLAIVAFGAIKVLITLFKSYFQLLLSVILGPLQITLGAIPGNNAAIMNWVKSVLRNVLVFPVVFFIVNIPNALVANGDASMRLRLPAKLVYESGEYNAGGPDVTGGIFIFVLRIFILFFAAQAPKFIESFLPPDSNKGLAAGFGAVNDSLKKVPLIGGLFGK